MRGAGYALPDGGDNTDKRNWIPASYPNKLRPGWARVAWFSSLISTVSGMSFYCAVCFLLRNAAKITSQGIVVGMYS